MYNVIFDCEFSSFGSLALTIAEAVYCEKKACRNLRLFFVSETHYYH